MCTSRLLRSMYRITLLDWSEKNKRSPGISRTRSMIVCPMLDKFARTILFLPSMSARNICGFHPTDAMYINLQKGDLKRELSLLYGKLHPFCLFFVCVFFFPVLQVLICFSKILAI